MDDDINTLIQQLQQFDNPPGYRLDYKTVKEKLGSVIARLAQQGDAAVDRLHELLQYEESWSCTFALETLGEIKSEKSIPHLIKFIKKNDDSDSWESCDQATFALEAIGKPAVEPLLTELKDGFASENFFGYLVEALIGIKDERVYDFMVETAEDYLKNPEKYDDWFEMDLFACGFSDQGRKEALPLLRELLAMEQLDKEEKKEIGSVIEELEDPEGYEKNLQKLAKEYEESDMPEAAKETIKVNCDFCGNEMECPPDMMKKAKKHMCHECFYKRAEEGGDEDGPLEDVHVDIPTDKLIPEVANNMTNSLVDEAFPDIWAEKKDELKELSKKELAYEMFGAGAYNAISQMLHLQHRMRDLKKK